MKPIKLLISDETLRDGEQQVGIFFSEATKYHLAGLIAQSGVDQIAIMPAIHPSEESLVRALVADGLRSQLVASTMLTTASIQQSFNCGVEQIILFHAVSDQLMVLRDPDLNSHPVYAEQTIDDQIPRPVIQRMQQAMLDKVIEHLRYATSLGLKICFAAEDASRADFNFLVDCVTAFAPYVDLFILCDTVGVLTPEKTFVWVHDLIEYSPQVPFAVHFHNDMGLALENTIQAILAGASGISGTFGGIGERAGNVAIEQVLNGLRLRFGLIVDGIDYGAIAQVTAYLDELGAKAHPPYSQQAQRQEAGIHVHSLLRDRQSYNIFPYSEPEIWFGKHSGASNCQYLFEHYLQKPVNRETYTKLSLAIKAISIQENRSFSIDEVLKLIEQGIVEL